MCSIPIFEKTHYEDVKNFLLYFKCVKDYKETKEVVIKHLKEAWEKTIFLMNPKEPLLKFVKSIFFLEVIEKLDLTTEEKILLFTTPFIDKIKNISSQQDKENFFYFVKNIEELKPLVDFIKYIDFNTVKSEITKNF